MISDIEMLTAAFIESLRHAQYLIADLMNHAG